MSARGNPSPASPANEVLTFAAIVEKCEKTNIAIEEMKKLAPARDVELRNAGNTPPIKWDRQGYCEAALMQATGQEAENPCERCAEGKGRFVGCVVSPIAGKGACANCKFTSREKTCCSLYAGNNDDNSAEPATRNKRARDEAEEDAPRPAPVPAGAASRPRPRTRRSAEVPDAAPAPRRPSRNAAAGEGPSRRPGSARASAARRAAAAPRAAAGSRVDAPGDAEGAGAGHEEPSYQQLLSFLVPAMASSHGWSASDKRDAAKMFRKLAGTLEKSADDHGK
ncbi:12b6b58a-daa7-4811-9004-ef168a3359ca [Thermothielavioides terrestris]|uniref:12b6b58a-daa7-4811-9004-ef168a3359ca n=1 Tax=Thermothielavioides terrestris TaxID=2587410 RepID=A0A3S4ARD5_9PEZI|nr:12b6b58a-daa7-4811-9004-ef168a3359ca [Thermothielavioides terrestris]